jgi:hypothetical protein
MPITASELREAIKRADENIHHDYTNQDATMRLAWTVIEHADEIISALENIEKLHASRNKWRALAMSTIFRAPSYTELKAELENFQRPEGKD